MSSSSYYSLVDILSDDVVVPCIINVPLVGFGYLDSSASEDERDVKPGARCNLPFWMAKELAGRLIDVGEWNDRVKKKDKERVRSRRREREAQSGRVAMDQKEKEAPSSPSTILSTMYALPPSPPRLSFVTMNLPPSFLPSFRQRVVADAIGADFSLPDRYFFYEVGNKIIASSDSNDLLGTLSRAIKHRFVEILRRCTSVSSTYRKTEINDFIAHLAHFEQKIYGGLFKGWREYETFVNRTCNRIQRNEILMIAGEKGGGGGGEGMSGLATKRKGNDPQPQQQQQQQTGGGGRAGGAGGAGRGGKRMKA